MYISPMLTTFLLSLIVVRGYSIELWGEFIKITVWVNLVNQISNWGNREYLLREFSLRTADAPAKWKRFLSTRWPVQIVLSLAVSLLFNDGWLIFIWSNLLFFNQSYDVLIVYKKKYERWILADLVSSLVILLIVIRTDELNLFYIIASLSIGLFIKLSIIYAAFYKEFNPWPSHFNFVELWNSFSFLILSLSGFAAFKVDVYIMTFFFEPKRLGHYMIISSMLLMAQMVSAFIFVSFVKEWYRFSRSAYQRVHRKYMIFGIIATPCFIIGIGLTTYWLYRIEFNPEWIPFAGVIIYTTYLYTPITYRLFKHHLEHIVMWVNLISTALCAALLIIRQTNTIGNALFMVSIVQFLMFVMLWFAQKYFLEKKAVTESRLFHQA